MEKILIHTDVFRAHLRERHGPSALRTAVGRYFCYTSVCTALELFAGADSAAGRRTVEDALGVVKILGINARNAPRYGRILRTMRHPDPLAALVAGLCLDGRLPLLTDRREEFRGIPGLRCIPTSALGAPPRTRRRRHG